MHTLALRCRILVLKPAFACFHSLHKTPVIDKFSHLQLCAVDTSASSQFITKSLNAAMNCTVKHALPAGNLCMHTRACTHTQTPRFLCSSRPCSLELVRLERQAEFGKGLESSHSTVGLLSHSEAPVSFWR